MGPFKHTEVLQFQPLAASPDILSNASQHSSILHQTVLSNPIKHVMLHIFALNLSSPHTYLEVCKDVDENGLQM